MAEKRKKATQRKISLKEGEVDEPRDEIDLGSPSHQEETKGEMLEPPEPAKEEKKAPFKKPLSRETVQAYSRWLHRNTPSNHYFRVKIPYKTILIAFIFLCVGSVLLWLGINELLETGATEAWEKIILGSILFIPGSFHSFLAFMAIKGVDGYDYEHLTVFENDKFFEED